MLLLEHILERIRGQYRRCSDEGRLAELGFDFSAVDALACVDGVSGTGRDDRVDSGPAEQNLL
jgi:hypothetical protein